MPYKTTWKRDGIIWTYSGRVTAAEIEEANAAFLGDSRSDRAVFQVIDARDVDSIEWGDRDVKKTAAYDVGAGSIFPVMRVAYVAPDPAIRALLDTYAEVTSRHNSSWLIKGFDDIEAALSWAENRSG